MTSWTDAPLRSLEDIARFEAEMPIEDRLPGSSVFDVFLDAAEKHGDRTALTMLMTGSPDEQPRRVTYSELLGLVRQAANLFSTLGGENPGVAYMLPTLVETHATLWGAETAGYAVPINFLLQVDQIAELLKASDAKILVAMGPHPQLDIWEKAIELRKEVPGLTLVQVAPPGGAGSEDIVNFHEATTKQPSDRLIFEAAGSGDEVAAYFHTGGTTGVPKLLAHTHSGQLAAALGGAALSNFSSDDVGTGTLPMFHVAGTIYIGLSCFIAGAEIVLMSPAGLRNPTMVTEFWRICERHGVTIGGGVPTSIGALLEVPIDGADIARMHSGLTGAASLPAPVRKRFTEVTGKSLNEVYGMTEASGLIAINPFAAEGGEGSVGYGLPYSKLRIRHLNADGSLGEDCAPNEVGVLTVRGPNVSPGYRNAEQNEGVFVDGELNSGDLAYLDEDSRVHIAGRSKDLIIRSGHNIDPLMIEEAMQNHPAVALAAAVGAPDEYAGELPVCFVMLRPGETATESDLRAHAEAEIAERPAWPKDIYIVDAIPMTSVGKIFKPDLRCEATSRLVKQVLQGWDGLEESLVEVSAGGRRGMTVTVTVPNESQGSIEALQQKLGAYLFEADVRLAT